MTTTHSAQSEKAPVKPNSAKKPQQKNLKPTISQPTIKKKITLHSASAQYLMDREFERLARALFLLDVPMLFSEDTKIIEKYRQASDKAYDQLNKELQAALHNTRKLAEKNNIEQDIFYKNAETYTTTIRTPRALAFMNLIVLFDQLIMCVDNLWMNNEALVGGSKKRIDHHREWQKRITRFMQEIITFQFEQYQRHKQKNTAAPKSSQPDQATQPKDKNVSPPTESTPLAVEDLNGPQLEEHLPNSSTEQNESVPV